VDSEIIFVFEKSPEGGFEARALDHSIFTQADTFEDLKKEIQDAVCCHFDDGETKRIVIRAARIY